ncbi:MAG: ABC transporter permease [Acidobacteria bacterium]|nr:MAG: ABC transporter permease [Acidobacteriota bacterium]
MWQNLARLLRYRGLIQSLVSRELKARYRGSVLGFFWSFVNPLLLIGIYSFVFATIMKTDEKETKPFAVFMFCGILPWTWFSASLLEGSASLIAGGNLIKKVLFPAEVLPIVAVFSNMIHFLLGLPILAGFMIYNSHMPVGANLAWFPVIVLVQLVFTLGCVLVLSALTVHFRDLRDLLANLLTLWFFATPIIYPYFREGVKEYSAIFKPNPFFHLVVSYQESLFFQGPLGHWPSLLLLGGLSILFFLAAYWLFDRLRDSFAEVV